MAHFESIIDQTQQYAQTGWNQLQFGTASVYSSLMERMGTGSRGRTWLMGAVAVNMVAARAGISLMEGSDDQVVAAMSTADTTTDTVTTSEMPVALASFSQSAVQEDILPPDGILEPDADDPQLVVPEPPLPLPDPELGDVPVPIVPVPEAPTFPEPGPGMPGLADDIIVLPEPVPGLIPGPDAPEDGYIIIPVPEPDPELGGGPPEDDIVFIPVPEAEPLPVVPEPVPVPVPVVPVEPVPVPVPVVPETHDPALPVAPEVEQPPSAHEMFATPPQECEFLWDYLKRVGVPESEIMPTIHEAVQDLQASGDYDIEWHGCTEYTQWLKINGHSGTTELWRYLRPYFDAP